MVQDYKSQDIMKDKLGYLNTEQIKNIYRAAESARDKVLIRLLWMSGRRISEILQLKVNDIDFNREMITWNILKKKQPMRAQKTIDTKTIQLLKWYIFINKMGWDDYVLCPGFNRERHITRQRAFDIVRRLGKKAGIIMVGSKKLHPHHFRHSRAMRLAEEAKTPADIKKIQKILEHAHLGMTEHYLGFLEEDTRTLMAVE